MSGIAGMPATAGRGRAGVGAPLSVATRAGKGAGRRVRLTLPAGAGLGAPRRGASVAATLAAGAVPG